ncbi:hypothetical protein HYH02_003718 [Chlamydomonas schloesseri]|uniref:microtubule-severing ATPase n=1 Tax=Chlamydomonas schloesseri TaxID=2026947 RepID=A0A836BAB6_9CHLO|nr:hypothetical protein HYH02_003718 [Chlamydomonas schloesseri]|eukprot:KAG2451944.1 hypothetical protein HYH02_003718 [Chlamydomonas schloesseri]
MRISDIVDATLRIAEQLRELAQACFARTASLDAGLEEPRALAHSVHALCGVLTSAVVAWTLLASTAGLVVAAVAVASRARSYAPQRPGRGPAIKATAAPRHAASVAQAQFRAPHSPATAPLAATASPAAAAAAGAGAASAAAVAAAGGAAAAPAAAGAGWRHELPVGLLTRRYCQARLVCSSSSISGMKSFSGLLGGLAAAAGVVGAGSSAAGGGGGMSAKEQHKAQAKAREKLKGYHELAKEAFDRAASADAAGRPEAAVKLYRTGLEAAREGLALQLGPSAGLGPLADTAAGWRADLEEWTRLVAARLRALESGNASTSSPVRPVPVAQQRPQQPQQQHHQQSQPVGISGRPWRPASAAGAAPAVAVAAQPPRSVNAARQPAGGGSGGGTAVARQGSGGAAAAGAAGATKAGGGGGDDGLAKYREIVLGEVLDRTPGVRWSDIAGLETAKSALAEAVILPSLRPDLFQGLRAPVRGILLYGPPGNGKTMLAKALAGEAKTTFFNISASSLTSKWVGDGEKLVRALFEVAAVRQPALIFIDEIDSMMGARGKAGESDAARRLLTEFLVQFDGAGGAGRERVVVLGATNRPQELDEAVRRRLTKRIYVPLPDAAGRGAVLSHLLQGQPHKLSRGDLDVIVRATAGYSASDLAALCKEAAMAPLREPGVMARLASLPASELRSIMGRDFAAALDVVRPSVNAASLRAFEDFTREYGTQ